MEKFVSVINIADQQHCSLKYSFSSHELGTASVWHWDRIIQLSVSSADSYFVGRGGGGGSQNADPSRHIV